MIVSTGVLTGAVVAVGVGVGDASPPQAANKTSIVIASKIRLTRTTPRATLLAGEQTPPDSLYTASLPCEIQRQGLRNFWHVISPEVRSLRDGGTLSA